MSEETPTLKSEIDRKLVDYLANREVRRINGDIAPEVIGIEAGALWYVLSGLADNELVSLLSQLETQSKRVPIKRYFMNPSKDVLVLTYSAERPGWVLLQQLPDPRPVVHSTTETGDIRKARVNQLANHLLSNHYKEI